MLLSLINWIRIYTFIPIINKKQLIATTPKDLYVIAKVKDSFRTAKENKGINKVLIMSSLSKKR